MTVLSKEVALYLAIGAGVGIATTLLIQKYRDEASTLRASAASDAVDDRSRPTPASSVTQADLAALTRAVSALAEAISSLQPFVGPERLESRRPFGTTATVDNPPSLQPVTVATRAAPPLAAANLRDSLVVGPLAPSSRLALTPALRRVAGDLEAPVEEEEDDEEFLEASNVLSASDDLQVPNGDGDDHAEASPDILGSLSELASQAQSPSGNADVSDGTDQSSGTAVPSSPPDAVAVGGPPSSPRSTPLTVRCGRERVRVRRSVGDDGTTELERQGVDGMVWNGKPGGLLWDKEGVMAVCRQVDVRSNTEGWLDSSFPSLLALQQLSDELRERHDQAMALQVWEECWARLREKRLRGGGYCQ